MPCRGPATGCPRSSRSSAGGTHDPAFRQLLADATGLALAVTDAPDAAVVGAGLLAAGRRQSPRGRERRGRAARRRARPNCWRAAREDGAFADEGK